MKGPYFITTLQADILIRPDQMNNNIMENIKRNLEKAHTNKCFENYGYVDKIYEIDDDIKGGLIRAEDMTASSVHRVSFKCRICNPIIKSVIMGKIIGINNTIIVAENGPIRFMIGGGDVNKNNITFKLNAYYPLDAKGNVINKPIKQGSYVMIQVMNKKIVKGKTKIIVFGRLESVAPEDKVMDEIKSQYESGEKIVASDLINKLDKTEEDELQHDNALPEDTGEDVDNEDNDD